ncbi:NAD(P)-dependent oxidoreductase [Cellulomonas sp. URHD0024]|uniref:NAD-dependent epimerase/dehydratase family protein n=1 Tax=Cellulomonas sp. URHD0024 TaxID=1302620 RepID=UPI00040BD7A3|nr:NAD-dependent epimerase/dehydratase family protein [Cellulomonas sp. URHD0024]
MHTRSHSTVGVVGRGFLGSAVLARLERDGRRAVALDRANPSVVDDALSPELAEAYAVGPLTLVWAASVSNLSIAAARPDRARTDVDRFAEFLGAVARDAPTARVVLLSSGGTVYAPGTPPFTEASPTGPTTQYGQSRLRMERMLVTSDVEGTVLRIANVYGPGQPARAGQGVVAHWLAAAAEGRPAVVFGGLEVVRDFVYVTDVADAIVRAGDEPRAAGSVLNVGSGRPVALREVWEAVGAAVGRDVQLDVRPARPIDVPATWLDPELMRATTGWTAGTPLRVGVAAQWAALRETVARP